MTMPGDTDKRIEPTDPLGEGSAAGSDLAGSGHLRIAADGTWYHEGRPIPRKKLVQLFASVLRRDDDGRYWLKTPVETVPIEVEDAPFVAVELSRRGAGRDQALALRTNLDDWVPLDAAHPLEVHEDPVSAAPRPYIRVKDGLDALVARSVFYELADLAEPSGEDTLGVWSHGTFFPLGRTGTD
mgnify:CR=1 FL=1